LKVDADTRIFNCCACGATLPLICHKCQCFKCTNKLLSWAFHACTLSCTHACTHARTHSRTGNYFILWYCVLDGSRATLRTAIVSKQTLHAIYNAKCRCSSAGIITLTVHTNANHACTFDLIHTPAAVGPSSHARTSLWLCQIVESACFVLYSGVLCCFWKVHRSR
jgi:hypothetical protein